MPFAGQKYISGAFNQAILIKKTRNKPFVVAA